MRTKIFALALPVIAFGVAACGSSSNNTTSSSSGAASSSSSAATASSSGGSGADAVCASYNTQINAVTPTPAGDPSTADASALPSIAAWIDAVTPVAKQEQSALAAASDGAPVTKPFDDVITTLAGADPAAKSGDAASFKSAWANFLAAQNAFHAAATGANMPNCAK